MKRKRLWIACIKKSLVISAIECSLHARPPQANNFHTALTELLSAILWQSINFTFLINLQAQIPLNP